jgi:ribosomal-protein-alanine N-acetyltransferase
MTPMVRCLNERDLSQLRVIEAATQTAPWSEEAFQRCFQANSQGWAVEREGQIVGFILVLIQVGECHILNVGVLPAYQRQGHGRQLLEYALNQAIQQGASAAYLEVRRSNDKAIALYTSMGFKKIGERKNYYSAAEGREDAEVFAKELVQK